MFKTESYRGQWGQLIVLTGAHFVLDMYPGMMHTVLPALQDSFGLSVAAGAVLLTVFLVAANAIQVLLGHLRPDKEKPLLLYAGVVLTNSILLFGLVSTGAGALVWLSLIALAAGAGVGIAHPEGLRAVHRLEGISAAVSSSVFMGGGVFGFAFGGVVSTYLYERYEVMGLVPLCGLSVAVLVAMVMSGVKLAVEREPDCAADNKPPPPCGVLALGRGRAFHGRDAHATGEASFWGIFAVATLTACSVQVLLWIVPQHISGIGAELTQGGRTVSLFSLAGGAGGILWARKAAARGELRTIITMLGIGLVFVVLYLMVLGRGVLATATLAAGGFFAFGAYPLMVGLARKCEGPNLGRRMGLIVGGIWLAACILPMLLGPLAQRWGTGWILYSVPGGFAGALLLAMGIAKRRNSKSEILSSKQIQNSKK